MSDKSKSTNDIDEYIASLSSEECEELAIADLALDLANLLYHARQERGLSQAEAGARAGMAQQAVSRLEHSLGTVQFGRLQRYLEALGYTLEVEVKDKSTGQLLGSATP